MYDFPPYRPPSEAESILIRVTRGCPWNSCRFCGMYRDERFEIRPVDEIERDIKIAGRIFGERTTVFLGDSDNLVHPDLEKILDLIKKNLPHVRRITTYSRARTLSFQDEERLKNLRRKGLTRIHLGLESGDDEILNLLNKGISAEDAIKAGKKASDAGFEISEYVLIGFGERHARESARVLNRIEPHFIRIRSITPIPGTRLYDMVESGEVILSTPDERLKEVRILLENLDIDTEFLSDHVSNYLWSRGGLIYTGVNGKLPQDRDKMIKLLDRTIKTISELENSGNLFDSNDMFRMGKISL